MVSSHFKDGNIRFCLEEANSLVIENNTMYDTRYSGCRKSNLACPFRVSNEEYISCYWLGLYMGKNYYKVLFDAP